MVVKLYTIVWVVELMYLHVVVKCESLLGGHCKVHCTVKLCNETAYVSSF